MDRKQTCLFQPQHGMKPPPRTPSMYWFEVYVNYLCAPKKLQNFPSNECIFRRKLNLLVDWIKEIKWRIWFKWSQVRKLSRRLAEINTDQVSRDGASTQTINNTEKVPRNMSSQIYKETCTIIENQQQQKYSAESDSQRLQILSQRI